MNAASLHLLVNHIPVLGMPLAFLLLSAAVASKRQEYQHLALLLLIGLSIITPIVYFSGEPAEEVVEGLAGVSEAMIEPHEEAAELAFLGTELLGVVTVWTLIRNRRGTRVDVGLLVATAAVSVLLAWTAHQGGQIRHPESAFGVQVNQD